MPYFHRTVEILVVEDSLIDTRLISEGLEEAETPVRIHVVEDGDQAVAFLTNGEPYRGASRPDLVLLDLNLPGLHGLDVLTQIRSDPGLRSIPVIVLSSSSAEQDILRSYERYASSYVMKPADPDDFRLTVREIGRYWLETARLPTVPPATDA